MIAIEIQSDSKVAQSEKRSGAWVFLITHKNGKLFSATKTSPEMYSLDGTFDDVRPHAEETARKAGCVDGVDSIFAFFVG